MRRSSALNDRIDTAVGVAVRDGVGLSILSMIEDIFADKLLIEWMKQDNHSNIVFTKDPAPQWRKLCRLRHLNRFIGARDESNRLSRNRLLATHDVPLHGSEIVCQVKAATRIDCGSTYMK
jgi:hypothetical protein